MLGIALVDGNCRIRNRQSAGLMKGALRGGRPRAARVTVAIGTLSLVRDGNSDRGPSRAVEGIAVAVILRPASVRPRDGERVAR